jgi:cytoskeletal protein RodZ
VKNKLFHGALRLTILVLLLCVIAQRSPAPIVETPDNPTPPPTEQSSTQKWKRPAKLRSETATTTSKESRQKPASTGPARFAGNWSGSISQGILGTIKISFSINPAATSVRISGSEKPATTNGNTITWKAGWFNEITWTLTPQRDGTSALVTSKSGLGVNGTATFSKAQSEMASAPPSQQPPVTPPPSNPPANLPIAKPVPGQPGFIYNPFDPNPKAVFDVRSFAHGATMRDPVSGKLFIVP